MWVTQATNTIQKSTVLWGGRGLQTGRQDLCFSALHPFTKKHNGPGESSVTPSPDFHKHVRHFFLKKYVPDLEMAQRVGRTFFQMRSCATVHFGNLPPECLLRVESLDGQIIQKTPSLANKDHQKISSPFTGCYHGMQQPDTSRLCAGGDPTRLHG